MKIISKTLRLLPLFLFALAFQACSDDDDSGTIVPDPLNIVEIASANPNLSSLVLALQAADGDLVNILSGSGPFTVLAPTNEAFAAFLGDNELSDIPTDILEQVLLNHVISADLTSTDLSGLGAGYTSTNADGAGGENLSIYFDTSNGVRFNNIASVLSGGADVDASNGTIHLVDAVIALPNIVSHAVANPNLSELVGALTAGGNTTFTDLLSTPGDFTVFAPDNTAFGAFTNPNTNDINNVLSNHVIVGATAISTGLSSGYANTTAAVNADGDALTLYIDTEGGVTLNGTSTVTLADIVATNGVIHVVDTVIDLPTIATFATSNPAALGSLVAALQLADTGTPTVPWIATVSDATAGPFTVFAPTNDAFANLLLELDPSGNTALGDLDPATVDAVLLMHVASGNVRGADLPSLMGTVSTLGGDLALDVDTLTLTDGLMRDIGIIAALTDIQAVNGVVHVVDTVIRPTP